MNAESKLKTLALWKLDWCVSVSKYNFRLFVLRLGGGKEGNLRGKFEMTTFDYFSMDITLDLFEIIDIYKAQFSCKLSLKGTNLLPEITLF